MDLSSNWPEVLEFVEESSQDISPELILRDGRLDIYPEAAKYFDLRPNPWGLKLQPKTFVGLIPLNPRLTLDVRPRVPVGNFVRLLLVSGTVQTDIDRAIRRYATDTEFFPSLWDTYSRAMVSYIREAWVRGLLREYERREEGTSFPRGRILMSPTVKNFAPKGLAHRVQVSWFNRTIDNPANRCVKYALWRLIRFRINTAKAAGWRKLLRELIACYHYFDGVILDMSREFMRDSVVGGTAALPRLREYYRPLLELSRVIVGQQAVSLDRSPGTVQLPSMVLDMSDVFEAYLRNLLTQSAATNKWPVAVLDGNRKTGGARKPLLDEGSTVEATPDIVFADGHSSTAFPLVVEVKYKPGELQRDDLNQVISYGVSYKSPHVVVAQPKGHSGGKRPGLHPFGRVNDLSIHHYVFDLDATDLIAEENRFATEMLTLSLAVRSQRPASP